MRGASEKFYEVYLLYIEKNFSRCNEVDLVL